MAIGSVVENLPRDSQDVALSRIATAATLVTLTVAYALTLARRGFAKPAPFLFGTSFLVTGITVDMYGRAIAKSPAPFALEELPAVFGGALVPLAIVLSGSLAAWLWTHRKSRFPLF
jgi:hypothetical protein